MPQNARLALTLLRAGAAAILIVHGVARLRLGIVDDFGVVLGQWGFPANHALGWTITILEIAGGTAVAAGIMVRPMAAWFIVPLAMGVLPVIPGLPNVAG